MSEKILKAGDKVTWNSSQGKVNGTVQKKLTASINIKTHHVAASADEPQYLVKSTATGQKAAHTPEALKKTKSPS